MTPHATVLSKCATGRPDDRLDIETRAGRGGGRSSSSSIGLRALGGPEPQIDDHRHSAGIANSIEALFDLRLDARMLRDA